MEKDKEICWEKRPMPSGPGAEQITVEGCDSMKGGAPFVSEMPKKFVIPDGAKNEKGFSSRKPKY